MQTGNNGRLLQILQQTYAYVLIKKPLKYIYINNDKCRILKMSILQSNDNIFDKNKAGGAFIKQN